MEAAGDEYLLDTNPACSLDIENGKLTWNKAFYSTFGYPETEPAGSVEWWTMHIHPEDAMRVNSAMDKLLDPTITEWAVTYRFRKSDDTYLTVEDHVNVVRGMGGRASRLTSRLIPQTAPAETS